MKTRRRRRIDNETARPHNPAMLPPLRQRVLVTLSVLVGGACLWSMGEGEAVADAGPWLLSGEGVALLLRALPAVGLGLIAAAAGHPASGLFIVSVCLLMPAMVGGPLDPWLYRLGEASGYGTLLAESLAYGVLLAGFALLARGLRPVLRPRLPASLRSEHLGDDDPWGLSAVPLAVNLAIAALVGGVLAWGLLRSSYTGQVTGGLLGAFVLGAMAAHSFAPRVSLLGVALAPMVVAAVGYLGVLVSYGDAEALLAAWFRGELWGLALARPIDYAAAGTAGSVAGFGLGQALARARAEARKPQAVA